MKKGDTTVLQVLVRSAPYIALTVALIALIWIFMISPFLNPPPTEAQVDLARVTKDLNAVLSAEADEVNITVPLAAKAGYVLTVYPKNSPDLPEKCFGESCICIVEPGIKPFYSCVEYPQVGVCPTTGQCGGEYCFEGKRRVIVEAGDPRTVIVGKECNVVKVI